MSITFRRGVIRCQQPVDPVNCNRNFVAVECKISKGSEVYNTLYAEAERLANATFSGAANNLNDRGYKRKLIDAFTGILTEQAWLTFLNESFQNGPIASTTEFTDVKAQIDIELTTKKRIEVRSSYVFKGVKFGICHNIHSFKNIGPYTNSIKTSEVQKDYYCGALLVTNKETLLNAQEVIFYLTGSSTWNMMLTIGYNAGLREGDATSIVAGQYRVIKYKDSLDINEFLKLLSKEEGYTLV